jgi:hypothetical protein
MLGVARSTLDLLPLPEAGPRGPASFISDGISRRERRGQAKNASTSRPVGRGRCIPSAVLLRNATPSVLHQRHIGRVLRSS